MCQWLWGSVIADLGVFSCFLGNAVVGACSEVEGEIGTEKNICTWLNKCNSLNLISQNGSLRSGLHM